MPALNAAIGVGSGLRGRIYQVELNMNNLAGNPPNLLRERQKEFVVPRGRAGSSMTRPGMCNWDCVPVNTALRAFVQQCWPNFLSPLGFFAPVQSASWPLPSQILFATSHVAQIPNGSSLRPRRRANEQERLAVVSHRYDAAWKK